MNGFLRVVKAIFDWRIRGVRCVELVGCVCLAAVVVSVYMVKTAAGRENNEISRIEGEIRENEKRVRLLRAEATRLEQPARLEALSRQMGLQPVEVKRRADEDGLSEIAAAHQPPAPKPAAVAAPVIEEQADAPVVAVAPSAQVNVQASAPEGQQ